MKLDGGALAFELEDLQAFAQARRVSADAGPALATRLQPRAMVLPKRARATGIGLAG